MQPTNPLQTTPEIDYRQTALDIYSIWHEDKSEADTILEIEHALRSFADKVRGEMKEKYEKEMTQMHFELDRLSESFVDEEEEAMLNIVRIENVEKVFAEHGINAFPLLQENKQ